jgi:hypothetical protein
MGKARLRLLSSSWMEGEQRVSRENDMERILGELLRLGYGRALDGQS